MNTKPRTILILVGLFLAGAASGALVALRLCGRPPQRLPFAERNMERLEHILGLTPEQRSKIEVIVRTTSDEMWKLRHAGAAELGKMNAQIEVLLSPEQKTKFAVFQMEQAERMRRRMAGREQHGRPGSEGRPPPPPEGPPRGEPLPPLPH